MKPPSELFVAWRAFGMWKDDEMAFREGDWRSDDGRATVLLGDVKERLQEMEAGSVHVCVTSPPYFPPTGLSNWPLGGRQRGVRTRPIAGAEWPGRERAGVEEHGGQLSSPFSGAVVLEMRSRVHGPTNGIGRAT